VPRLILSMFLGVLLPVGLCADEKDCAASASYPHISVSQADERIIERKWPSPPPGTRIEGYAVFQVTVSNDGVVDCIKPVGGHPMLLSILKPAVAAWKFKSKEAFVALIAIRYSSEGYKLL